MALRQRGFLFWACVAAAAALMIAALVGLPGLGMRWGVSQGLRRLGMAEVRMGEVQFSPFGRRVLLRSVVARPPVGHELGLDSLELVFDWRPLLERRLAVETLSLRGLRLEARREGGTLVINGLPVPQGGGTGNPHPWRFGIGALRMTDCLLEFEDAGKRLDVAIQSLQIDGLDSGKPDNTARVSLKGRIDGAPIAVSGTLAPFSVEPAATVTVDADGVDLARLMPFLGHTAAVSLGGRAKAAMTITARLRDRSPDLMAEGHAILSDPRWTTDTVKGGATALSWRGNVHWLGASEKLTVAGTVTAFAASAEAPGLSLGLDAATVEAAKLEIDAKQRRLDWQGGLSIDSGRIAFNAPGEAQTDSTSEHIEPRNLAWHGHASSDWGGSATPTLHLDGRIEDAGATATLNNVAYAHDRLLAEGQADFSFPLGGKVALTTAAHLSVDGLSVTNRGGNHPLAAVEHAEATGLTVGQDGWPTADRLDVRGLTALGGSGKRPYPARIDLREARLDRLALAADGGLSADGVALDGLTLRLTRTRRGFLGFAHGHDGKGPKLHLVVGHVSVAGRSRLLFEDRTVAPAVKVGFDALHLTMGGVDSARPDANTPFQLNGRIAEGNFDAIGIARPFASPFGGQMHASIHALELPLLSAYAAKMLGVNIHTGHLDGKAAFGIDDDALAGKVNLVLDNLFVAKQDSAARRAAMPVETVLDLLRDSDDRIQLTVPVDGNLAKPDFDVSDVVSQAVGGALREAALTVLRVAFPLAALVEAAGGDDQLALDPLPFAPGDATVDATLVPRLTALGQLMQERPAIAISLCGAASVASDWPALLARMQTKPKDPAPDHGELTDLAQKREDSVKSWLAEQAGISSKRLFNCRPTVDAGPKARPRVDLTL